MSIATRSKKPLVITILSISMLQMPMMAIIPSIQRLTQVFPDRTLSEIQIVMSLPSLISMFSAVLSAILITSGIISRKTAVISGLSLAILTGVASIFLHAQFWHLIVFSTVIGISLGFFIPTTTGIVFDAFDDDARQKITGYQTSFSSLGGIIMSAVGGILGALVWYGGYIAFLLMVPAAILAAVILPPGHKTADTVKTGKVKEQTRLQPDVIYYAVILCLFTMISCVCGNNLSTHLASNGIGDAATAGIAAAVQMAGGVASGLAFSKLTSRFKDYVIVFAFFALFIGFTIINIGHASLLAILVGAFITGSSLSMIYPQALLSVSKCVEPSSSSAATTLVCCFAPGAGAFLSPIILTNLTTALGGPSTSFRFQFTALAALMAGTAVALHTMRVDKKAAAAPLLVNE